MLLTISEHIRDPSSQALVEDPFHLLTECHRRVEHFSGLMLRLDAHLRRSGLDASARQAAGDVLRYFDQAAPLHHQDEEEEVFPVLVARGSEVERAGVSALEADHLRLLAGWMRWRGVLMQLISRPDPEAGGPVAGLGERGELSDWVRAYAAHIAEEETRWFPAARRLMTSEERVLVLRRMRARRQEG